MRRAHFHHFINTNCPMICGYTPYNDNLSTEL